MSDAQDTTSSKTSDVEEVCELPNGATLFRKKNAAGGYTYTSDEIGGGVEVWDTALVDQSTLMAAIVDQHRLQVARVRAGIRSTPRGIVCKTCGDSCQMFHSGLERYVPCIFCPTPCDECRSGGTGAYCSEVRCRCSCHNPTPGQPASQEEP